MPGRTVSFRRWMNWVAVLVLPLGIGFWYLRHDGKGGEEVRMAVESSIGPGSPKAILTMADGSVVDLGKAHVSQWEEKDGTRIAQDSAVLTYRVSGGKESPEQMYNKVEIPRGGEYTLVLSDGTVVALNAMSRLRYPVKGCQNSLGCP